MNQSTRPSRQTPASVAPQTLGAIQRRLQLLRENHFVSNLSSNVRIWNGAVLTFLDWRMQGGELPRLPVTQLNR